MVGCSLAWRERWYEPLFLQTICRSLKSARVHWGVRIVHILIREIGQILFLLRFEKCSKFREICDKTIFIFIFQKTSISLLRLIYCLLSMLRLKMGVDLLRWVKIYLDLYWGQIYTPLYIRDGNTWKYDNGWGSRGSCAKPCWEWGVVPLFL